MSSLFIGETVRVVVDYQAELSDNMKIAIDSCSIVSGEESVNLVANNTENFVLNGLVSMINSTANSKAEIQWHVFSIGNSNQLTIQCDMSIQFTTTTTTPARLDSVLILITRNSGIPILTDMGGAAKYGGTDFDFEFGTETEVRSSCSINWQGEMYLYGGNIEKRQVSLVEQCQLKRVSTLSFDLSSGACTNINNEEVVLCFGDNMSNSKKCWKSSNPEGPFSSIADSLESHRYTRIANDQESILALSGYSPDHKTAEKFNLKSNTWTNLGSYPYATNTVYRAPIIYVDAFYVFGGWDQGGQGALEAIGRLDSNNNWSLAGNLNTARRGHGAIYLDNSFLVVGGEGNLQSEKCDLDRGTVSCTSQEPSLNSYYSYPELYLVSNDYCQKSE